MSPDRTTSDPEFMAAYGEAVQKIRRGLTMERKELAHVSGISYSYLSAIESGQKVPSGTVQGQLAAALGVSEAELLAMANDEMGAQLRTEGSWLLPSGGPSDSSSGWGDEAESSVLRMASSTPQRTQMSPSGALQELGALVRTMSPDDAAMVVSLARRLAAANPQDAQQRRYRRQERTYRTDPRRRNSRTEAYLQVWTMYIDELNDRGIDWAQGRSPEPRSYFTTRSPIRGTSMSASFARNQKIRHEMYINRGSRAANLELLDQLREKKELILDVYGAHLDFEDPGQERRAVRLAEYRDGHYSRSDEFGEYVEWFIDRGTRMRRAIEAFLASERADS